MKPKKTKVDAELPSETEFIVHKGNDKKNTHVVCNGNIENSKNIIDSSFEPYPEFNENEKKQSDSRTCKRKFKM